MFQQIPLWAIFIIAFAVIILGFEAGFRLGNYQRIKRQPDRKPPPNEIVVTTMLGLLAFLLAFTFGLAASRYNDRRVLVMDEANSIGTTYLRAEFLPEANKREVQNLLRRYVDVRLKLQQDLDKTNDPQVMLAAVAEANKIQDLLWNQAIAVSKIKDSPLTGLFTNSLNETIDLQSKRVWSALHSQLPLGIWFMLMSVSFLGMSGIGYLFGTNDSRNLIMVIVTAAAYALVISMIADLDRPTEGALKAFIQPIVDLHSKIGSAQPSH